MLMLTKVFVSAQISVLISVPMLCALIKMGGDHTKTERDDFNFHTKCAAQTVIRSACFRAGWSLNKLCLLLD